VFLLIEEVPLSVLENFGPNVPEEFGGVGFDRLFLTLK